MIHKPPARSSDQEWEKAFNDAIRSIRSLPTPQEVAQWLEPEMLALLADSISVSGGITVCGTASQIADLRQRGLVEINTRCLTALGIGVRRLMRERDV